MRRPNCSPPRNLQNQTKVKSTQSNECSRKQNEKSKSSWEEAGYIPISPMSDEAAEAPTIKVYQSAPMFDDPISSASEDERRVGRATFKSKVVTAAKLYETPGSTYVCNHDVTISKYISSKHLEGRVSTGNYTL